MVKSFFEILFLLEILLKSSAVAVLDVCLFSIKLFIKDLADLRISLGLLEYFDFLSSEYVIQILFYFAYFVSFYKFD